MKSSIFIFLLCINIHLCTSQVVEVFEFGMKVYDFFDKIFGDGKDNTPPPIDYERIIGEITDQIRTSTAAILHKTEIEAHLSDVRRSARGIIELLEQMKHLIETKNQTKRQAFEKQFLLDYQQEKKDLYSLKTLLTLTVPGISNTLLRLIANEVNCGMTGLEDFQTYYMNLVASAIAIDLVSDRMKDNARHENLLEMWNDHVVKLIDEFGQEKNRCKNNFLRLAREDFDSINEAQSLFDNNQKRFSYMRNDVLFLGGSYCAIYLKDYTSIILKQDHQGDMVVAAFGGNDNVAHFSKFQFDKVSKMHFDQCTDTKETQNTIGLFDVLEYDVVFHLMYPESQVNDFQILLDNNTAANVGVIMQNSETYKTIIYVRTQTMNSTTLYADDYAVYFRDIKTSAAYSLFDKMSIFNVCFVFITKYYV